MALPAVFVRNVTVCVAPEAGGRIAAGGKRGCCEGWGCKPALRRAPSPAVSLVARTSGQATREYPRNRLSISAAFLARPLLSARVAPVRHRQPCNTPSTSRTRHESGWHASIPDILGILPGRANDPSTPGLPDIVGCGIPEDLPIARSDPRAAVHVPAVRQQTGPPVHPSGRLPA